MISLNLMLYAAGGAAILAVAAWLYMRGRRDAKAKADADRQGAAEMARAVEDTVAKRTAEANRERLVKWSKS